MTVLITGVMGFIGSAVAGRLLRMGYSVVGFDNLENPSLAPTDRIKAMAGLNWDKFRFYKVDVCNLDTMMTICQNEGPIDYVIHLAALGSISRSFADPGATIRANEIGFANVLQLCSGLRVKRLVFASSSNVYGTNEKPIKIEGEEGFPTNPYGLSKLQNEMMARIWRNVTGLEYIGLRFFNVYGPGQTPFSQYAAVIPRFITQEKLVIYGDGNQTRDFTYVGDVANACEFALTSKGFGVCLNVGAGQSTRISELAQMLAHGRPIEYRPARPGEIMHSQASVEMSQKILGFKPETTLADGLKETMGFYEKYKAEQNN